MIIVKLIVLICCVNDFTASTTDYCEICFNHTLCQYKMQGPSLTCKSYDKSALLTSQDIIDLVNRINERRNFVAMGYSTFLPHAADMKKIHWSTDLATFAQRWADQCDQSVHPDKQDQCRDLENIKVGQNIASVMGPSPGLNIKGFVEMWFIQILDYTGSVTYYNESRDYKTSYFTQLIWADTEFVGCGKAKFYVDEKNAMIERLVCNFAPKGNTHRRPVYSIGYPGTQCKENLMPDEKLKGLCVSEDIQSHKKITYQRRPVNSLLRILNLSNDPVTHEIDPIRNGIRQTNVNSHSNNEQRNQKTRHILSNKTYTAVKRIPQLRKQMIRKNFQNFSGNDHEYHYQHDRGHSHLYHGHEPQRYNYEFTTPIYTDQDFRKYDYTTESSNLYSTNSYRKYYQNVQCTRRIRPEQNNCVSNQCTSDPLECCSQTTICPSTCTEIACTKPVEECTTCPTSYMPPLPDPCTCTKQTCPPLSTNCNYDVNCQSCTPCPTYTHCLTTICPEIRKKNNDYRKTDGTFQYYDMIPNVVVRSGNYEIPQESSSHQSLPYLDNSETNKKVYEGKNSDQKRNGGTDYSKYKLQEHDYIYHSFDSSLKKKRNIEDQVNLKPFWQIENVNNNRQSQLRNIKYTTLSNKKNRKTRKYTESVKWSLSTEPITLKLSDYEYQPERVTEKYLSFDELMHLRKINGEYSHYDLRRKGAKTANGATTKAANNQSSAAKETSQTTKKAAESKATAAKNATKATTKTTATSKTTEYTANTPFERKKHCTRKLTCTWTAFTANGADGDKGIRGPEIGSRTPPGYVEGCTRTSTCTRDYMDRNKISTIPDDSSSEPTTEDEDYCERRSLNVQRRNSDDKIPTGIFLRYPDYTDLSNIKADGSSSNDPILDTMYLNNFAKSDSKTHICICNERNSRKKRQGTKSLRDKEYDESSYADVYYLILNKILHSNQANQYHTEQCLCSGSINCSRIEFFIFFIHFSVMFRFLNNDVT